MQYRLHDWCISRQRYWGPPIPIIYCDDLRRRCRCRRRICRCCCPTIEDFRPDDSGVSPLARHEEWYYVALSRSAASRAGARPTSPTPSSTRRGTSCATRAPSSTTGRSTRRGRRSGCPVTTYIGGNEHAVLHLLYSRFITMVLHDAGHARTSRSRSRKFRAHGLIIKDGAKMSKSQRQRGRSPTSTSRAGAPTPSACT